MNNKGNLEIRRNRRILISIITLMVLVITCLLIDLIYHDIPVGNNSNKKPVNVLEQNNLTDEETQELLIYIPYQDFYYDKNETIKDAYSIKNIENIDEEILLISSWSMLKEKQIRNVTDDMLEGITFDGEATSALDVETFNHRLSLIYNTGVTKNEFQYAGTNVIKGKKYYVAFETSGCNNIKKISKVLSAVKKDNSVEIVEKVGFIYETEDKYELIDGREKAKVVKTFDNLDEANRYANSNINDFTSYKHTFKIIDGYVYWISTIKN